MRLLCSARGSHVDGVGPIIKLNGRTSEVLIVVYQNITSGDEDGTSRNVFLLVFFTIL